MTYRYATRYMTLSACVLAGVLSGCVNRPQPLYHWGDFQAQQYAHLNGDKGPEDSIQALEKVHEEAKAEGKPVPPGFQAHLGMLYGITGRTDLFEQHLQAEQQQFPESSAYVGFLLKTNQDKTKPQHESK